MPSSLLPSNMSTACALVVAKALHKPIRLTPVRGQAKTLIAWKATFDLREPDPQQQQSAAIYTLIVGGHLSLQSCLAGLELG
ncbi:hypothetical protein CNX70_19885 [Janthinobacterium svalbardensis]|uniref:Uncharacterized protein n=1 Tax=Janthinobacterium svalbardensis TaxID=368607 RepID=A0A290WZ72_9BURK|nr:hypothetical protein [Janthinobacterium svalbardensis]ATD62153.1 hypothetical protein CNX70_19885 [Janthinobacterium svalbardensis]